MAQNESGKRLRIVMEQVLKDLVLPKLERIETQLDLMIEKCDSILIEAKKI